MHEHLGNSYRRMHAVEMRRTGASDAAILEYLGADRGDAAVLLALDEAIAEDAARDASAIDDDVRYKRKVVLLLTASTIVSATFALMGSGVAAVALAVKIVTLFFFWRDLAAAKAKARATQPHPATARFAIN